MKTKKIPTEKTASNIGKIGENMFENIIDQYMSDYKIENVAKQGKSGDFKITWVSHKTNKTYKILVDVKKYSSSVPSKEVEKFYRDININKVDGGLLLSLTSKICGISKMIDFKEYQNDTGKTTPILFTFSSTPSTIVEVIKLLFHAIEIKDICNNDVGSFDELYSHIDQLNENVQTIMECRDLLQASKTSVEKSLNDIMYKLMSCEYSLVSKINAINSSLINKYELDHIVEETESGGDPLTMVQTVIDIFGSNIKEDSVPFLYQIFNLGWDTSEVNISKQTWTLHKGSNKINIRAYKGATKIMFPIISESVQKLISGMKNIKITKNHIEMVIESSSMNDILKICKVL